MSKCHYIYINFYFALTFNHETSTCTSHKTTQHTLTCSLLAWRMSGLKNATSVPAVYSKYQPPCYLIFFLLFILIYGPVFSIIAIGEFIGTHKLNMTKIFSSLSNNTSHFCRDKKINL